jgi:hypothetical protein
MWCASLQEFTAAEAELQQMNLQLAAAVAERNMAEPRSRLAAEEARVHAENAVVRRIPWLPGNAHQVSCSTVGLC